jgi:valyl-tRNA synthetase
MARMAEEQQGTLAEQLKEIGAQLDWVRDYL